MHSLPRSHTPARALTLIELLVVIAILGVAAGLLLPRMVERGHQLAETDVAHITSLLSGAAGHATFTSTPMMLDYEADTACLRLLSPRPAPQDWGSDPFQAPVVLHGAELVSAAIDGDEVDGSWRVPFSETSGVSITVRHADHRWVVRRDPYAMRARWAIWTDRDTLDDGTMDLDAAGLGDASW